MGKLDGLLSGQSGASPWGVLYQSPLLGESEQDKRARDAAALGSMGVDPLSMPQTSPFDPTPNPTRPTLQPPGFGAGAVPFGFAGPGSMQVDPSMLAPAPPAFGAGAKPVPFAPGPVTAQPPARPATNLSSADRPPPAPGVNAPNTYVPIGTQADGSNYDMPMFGRAPAAPGAPAAPESTTPGAGAFSSGGIDGGLADRLSKATTGFIGNLHNGPVGALAGGLGALVTGRNTDPSSIEAEKSNATTRALLGKGAAPADVRAAQNNQDLMKALINQYYGPKAAGATGIGNPLNLNPTRRAPAAPAAGSIQNGYRFKGGNPADRNNWEQLR
jgi:hypothetical protein